MRVTTRREAGLLSDPRKGVMSVQCPEGRHPHGGHRTGEAAAPPIGFRDRTRLRPGGIATLPLALVAGGVHFPPPMARWLSHVMGSMRAPSLSRSKIRSPSAARTPSAVRLLAMTVGRQRL
jgi:hypothetical protein